MKHLNSVYLNAAIVALFICLSCSQRDQTIQPSPSIIEVNLEKEKLNYPINEVFASARYLRLCLNDQNLIQTIDKVFFASNDDVIVVDKSLNRIHRFDKNGNPIYTLSSQGKGPEEYVQLNDVAYEEVEDQLFVLDLGSQSVLYYDKNGKMKKKLYFEAMQLSGPTFFAHGNRLFFDRAHYPMDGQNIAIFDTETLGFQNSYLPLSEYNIKWGLEMRRVFAKSQDTVFYIAPMSFEIYKIPHSGTPQEAYKIDFGKHQPKIADVNEARIDRIDVFHQYIAEKDQVYNVFGLNVTENIINFSFVRRGGIVYQVIYNRDKRDTKIFYDLEGMLGQHRWAGQVLTANGKELVGVIYGEGVDLEKSSIDLGQQNATVSNPVLAFYTLK